jgi:hypothetical protein
MAAEPVTAIAERPRRASLDTTAEVGEEGWDGPPLEPHCPPAGAIERRLIELSPAYEEPAALQSSLKP